MPHAVDDFRAGMEPSQGESENVYRFGIAIFGGLFALPLLFHLLASIFA